MLSCASFTQIGRFGVLTLVAILASGACKEGGETDTYTPEASGGEHPDVPEGPAPACKAYPEPVAIAALNEALGPAPEPQLSVTFFGAGSIQTVGGAECAPFASSTDPSTLGTNWMSCFESYDCGGCEVWAGYYEGDAQYPEAWYLISRDQDAACARYDAFYQLLDPKTVASGGGALEGEVVGGDGGGGDPCGDCLSSCQGLSSCCTGTGCACESACAPKGCLPGLTMCCGIGSCICTDNCPY